MNDHGAIPLTPTKDGSIVMFPSVVRLCEGVCKHCDHFPPYLLPQKYVICIQEAFAKVLG